MNLLAIETSTTLLGVALINEQRVLADECIKQYTFARQKVFNFYKAWKRFEAEGSSSTT